MGRSPPAAVPGGRGGSAAARQQQGQRPKSALRADTEDEESSREEEGGSSLRAVAGNRCVFGEVRGRAARRVQACEGNGSAWGGSALPHPGTLGKAWHGCSRRCRRVGGAKPAAGGKKPAAGSKGAAQKGRSTRASPSAALKPRSKNVRA